MLPESVQRRLSFRPNRRRSARCRSTVGNGWETLESRQLLAADPVLSEFVALNRSTLSDEDGHFSDWLEIENRGDQPATLDGYYLTDSRADLTAWQLPTQSLAPGQSLLIFASGKDRYADTLHTNFTLADEGGFSGAGPPRWIDDCLPIRFVSCPRSRPSLWDVFRQR